MDISREFGSRLDSYRRNKRSVPVGIFGSFHRYELLESLRDHLIGHGYPARLSTDLAKRHLRHDGEDEDVYNLRISKILVDESGICIFVVFHEHEGEENINQSVSQEAQYLYDQQDLRKHTALPRVLVLVEDGCKPASLFRGLVKTCHPRWNESPFSTRKDLLMAARQFCWNVAGEGVV
jgi:hypothetical protein